MHRNKSNHAHAHRDAYWHTYLYAYTSGPFEWDMKVTFCVKACIRSCMHVKCLPLCKIVSLRDGWHKLSTSMLGAVYKHNY